MNKIWIDQWSINFSKVLYERSLFVIEITNKFEIRSIYNNNNILKLTLKEKVEKNKKKLFFHVYTILICVDVFCCTEWKWLLDTDIIIGSWITNYNEL